MEVNVPAFRILRKITKHATRAEHNTLKLGRLLTEKHLFKGLSPKRFPLNLPDTPIDIQLKWERAHVKLSRSLTEILVDYWTRRYQKTNQEWEDLWRTLEEQTTEEELKHIKDLIQKTKDETEQRIAEAEQKKVHTTEAMETEETIPEEEAWN